MDLHIIQRKTQVTKKKFCTHCFLGNIHIHMMVSKGIVVQKKYKQKISE